MQPIEQEFLRAIATNNNRLVWLCLEKGLTANTCDDNGTTALEYALRCKNDEVLARLATHPKTTQKTLKSTLDLLETLRSSDPDFRALKEYEKKASFLNKILTVLFFKSGNKALFKSSQNSLSI